MPSARSASWTFWAVAVSSSQVSGTFVAVLVEQVLAVVERRRVGEEGQRDELAVDGLALDDRGEMVLGDAGEGLRQVEELVGELRRPDHVDAVDVDVGVPGREPQLVLGELVGGRGRHRDEGDRVAGLLLPGLHQLLVDLDVGADRARDEVDVDGQRGRRPERREHGADDKGAAHAARLRVAHPILPEVRLCLWGEA